MPGRSPLLAAVAAALVLVAGCQAATAPPDQTTSSSSGCSHAYTPGDGGLGASFDYDESHNDFATAVPITLCMYTHGSPVHVFGSVPEIVVDPEPLPATEELRHTFTVTVQPGAEGHLKVEVLNDRGEPAVYFNGPQTITDDTGWVFGPWGEAALHPDGTSSQTLTAGPSSACNHGPDTGGDDRGDGADPGLGVGADYDESPNDFATAAALTLCMRVNSGSVRMVGTTPEITVEPETLPATEDDRYTFTVTVRPGAEGHLEVDLLNTRGQPAGHFNGPGIVADDTGWAFGPW
ncbi:hypothetical protein ACGIF2_07075 [Cellulomonas sp. P22]|uniref:hypothetical protein n=1 Tax=Cellulomonas sp. P22 TaxID=3373189 RepID=UPI0037BD2DC6